MQIKLLKNLALVTVASGLLSTCAIPAELQAKMDEYARTIPTCSGNADCERKWSLARAWVEANSDFAIRGESDTRIMATSNIISTSGMGVVVTRVAANGGDQITVDLECFAAYGCPNIWDSKLDFNLAVNSANN
jgi:hypothetical protein